MVTPRASSRGPGSSTQPYTYDDLPSGMSFRVAEVLPGRPTDRVVCRLHSTEWHERPQYDAISYNWGNPHDKVTIVCDGRSINVTRNLYTALVHFRQRDQSRTIWADALCINQESIPERGLQVKQMKIIYEKAQHVLVWLGADNDRKQAETAISSIYEISDFLSEELEIALWHNNKNVDTYQEMILKNRDRLPLPDAAGFASEALLRSLVWFYSHRFFTRVWAIQEVTANERCKVHVGHFAIDWNRVDLVACYLIMDETFSDRYGFSKANCWYVATFTEMIGRPARWLNTLYLASNYGCLDARDVIYGLRGLMAFKNKAGSLLDPDYSKSTEEVYRDCVETSFENFNNTDVLLYVTGKEHPSWIPRWNEPMLFRNPFRFGKPMPWNPAAGTTPDWAIDKAANTLEISGVMVDAIELVETYNQLWFADSTMNSETKRTSLRESWSKVLRMLSQGTQNRPVSRSALTSLAISISFGLNHRLAPSEQVGLLQQFVAYLFLVFADSDITIREYIPSELLEESKDSDGRSFGKPVWDFQYPDASIFVTKGQLIGCAISPTQPDDAVFVPYGSSYPLVLRPVRADDKRTEHAIRGFSYVDGIMLGERTISNVSRVTIC